MARDARKIYDPKKVQTIQLNDTIKDLIQLFITKLLDNGIKIHAVYLFGSHAKSKEHEWSDIDLAVISPDFTNSRLEERIRLTLIANQIDSRIEPVPFRPNTFITDDPLVWEIKTFCFSQFLLRLRCLIFFLRFLSFFSILFFT